MTINLAGRLAALSTEALAFVPPDKADATARQWLGGDPSSIASPQWLVAKSLALELALIVPSVTGTTAFDRFARAMKGRPPEDFAAAALLRRSRMRLARISSQLFEDLATGETLTLLRTPFSGQISNGVTFGLFTTIDEKHILAARPLVPLDDGGMALARSFVRTGNLGLGNGVRCAVGLPADVQASVYLHDLIALAFATETVVFQAGEVYRSAHSSHRRSATNSFQIGLARGINQKLKMLHQARAAAGVGSNGRALIPIKDAMIDDEMERLSLTFRRRSTARRRVLPSAYNAGKEAGERFEYRPGIEQR